MALIRGEKERNTIKMLRQTILRTSRDLVAILLASSVVFSGAQTAPTKSATPAQSAAPAHASAAAVRPAPVVWQGSQANRLSSRAEMYYEAAWGVGEPA